METFNFHDILFRQLSLTHSAAATREVSTPTAAAQCWGRFVDGWPFAEAKRDYDEYIFDDGSI